MIKTVGIVLFVGVLFGAVSGGSDFNDRFSLQIGGVRSVLHKGTVGNTTNPGGGVDLRSMWSLVNAIAGERDGFFVSDWWGVAVAVGHKKYGSTNTLVNFRLEMGPKIGVMIGDGGDVYIRGAFMTGNNSMMWGAYCTLLGVAGFNSPVGRLEIGGGGMGAAESNTYFVVDGAIRIPGLGKCGIGSRYERFGISGGYCFNLGFYFVLYT